MTPLRQIRTRFNAAFIGSCWSVLALSAFHNASSQPPLCPGIHVTVLGIRGTAGTVDCALFDSQRGFPVDVLHFATRVMVMKVPSSEARCDFEGIPPGSYALVVLHDENMNGKVDTNWIGIPKEGYGFSKDAKASLSAPSFKDATFLYDGQALEMTVNLHY